jgi:hypothetical protein
MKSLIEITADRNRRSTATPNKKPILTKLLGQENIEKLSRSRFSSDSLNKKPKWEDYSEGSKWYPYPEQPKNAY